MKNKVKILKKNELLDKYKIQVYNLLEKYISSLTFLEELNKIKDKKRKQLLNNLLINISLDIAKINLEIEKIKKELLK